MDINYLQKSKFNEIKSSFDIEKKNCSDDSIIFTNGFDLSIKKGFSNFGLVDSPRLNAIIQMLTSIKEIYELMDCGEENENKINKFDHIFVLTSFFA